MDGYQVIASALDRAVDNAKTSWHGQVVFDVVPSGGRFGVAALRFEGRTQPPSALAETIRTELGQISVPAPKGAGVVEARFELTAEGPGSVVGP